MSENPMADDRDTRAAVDGAMAAALFEIASEVSVLRDRLYAAEQLLHESGVLADGTIDTHAFSEGMEKRCADERKQFTHRILSALAGNASSSRSGEKGQ